ncbi:MAG: BatA domain-containing protein [Planctomycetota bacterium]|nr:BatA domain-containing protein [Planctomycetota bacterium]
MGGLFGGFVNAGIVAGAALALVPLVIHILNRRRHKPMRWAAMRFVQAAHKRTRRRVRMENWLLLLLRMSAIALLALVIARPFTGNDSPLAGITETRRDLVVILDGSASTGWREGVETVFERGVVRARELLRGLSGPRGDRALVVLAGGYPRTSPWATPEQATGLLDTFQPTEESLDLASALAEAIDAAERESSVGARGALEVRLLTDLQRRSFLPSQAADGKQPLSEALDRLKELGVRVLVEDISTAASQPQNLALASVQPSTRVLGPQMPADLRVEVRNFGPETKNGVRVALEVDGERRPAQIVDVPARGRAEAVFTVSFARAGEHTLVARVEDGDKLPLDNTRAHVISVPPPARVLLVDGAPGAVIDEDEVGYLRAVLEPPLDDGGWIGSAAPFEPRTIPPEDLGTAAGDPAAYDVIWLANVESLPAPEVDRLEAWVASGGALVVSLGDRVDAASWNARAWRADGTGLLPAEIGSRVAVRSRSDTWQRVKSFAVDHPALEFFADERFQPLLTEIPVYEFFATRLVPGAKALATLDDDASSALLIERAYDRGRVFLWTSTIDPAWTRLPQSPATLVPFVHELLRYARSSEAAPRNVPVGTALAAEVAAFPRAVTLVRPDGTKRTIDGEPQGLAGNRWKLPIVTGRDVEASGLYRIETEGAGSLAFALEIDPFEGDLDRLSLDELGGVHPALVAVRLEGSSKSSSDADAAPRRGELWRPIAALCLAFLVLESLWGAWIGRRRRVRA